MQELQTQYHTGSVEAGAGLFEDVLVDVHHQISATRILHHETHMALQRPIQMFLKLSLVIALFDSLLSTRHVHVHTMYMYVLCFLNENTICRNKIFSCGGGIVYFIVKYLVSSIAHTLTLTLTHSHSHTHTHTLTLTHSHSHTLTHSHLTGVWKQELRLTRKGCRSVLTVTKILFSDMRLSTSSRVMMSAFFSTYRGGRST